MRYSHMFLLAGALFLSACGGGDNDRLSPEAEAILGGDGGGGDTAQADVSSVELLVSTPRIGTSGGESAELTALVKDARNRVLSGVEVDFSADSGAVQVKNAVTDDSGIASALLSTGGSPVNRTVKVAASSNGRSAENSVLISGSRLQINGPGGLTLSETGEVEVLLLDSSNRGIPNSVIEASGSSNLTLGGASMSTNASGQVTLQISPTAAGTGTLNFSALEGSVSASFSLNLSATDFRFTTPEANVEIPLHQARTVSVHWAENGTPAQGEIQFTSTRGSISGGDVSDALDHTDADGNAGVSVQSGTAGPATLIASIVQPGTAPQNWLSTRLNVEFVATQAHSLILQPESATIGVGGESAKIVAVVRDPDHNLVKNKQISFNLIDVSGGSLSSGTAFTDSLGTAQITYTSSIAPSAKDGVVINAHVVDASHVSASASLTVAQRELFVRLGTGNSLNEPDETRYELPYTVIVTDAAGNPVANQPIDLLVTPLAYRRGFYELRQVVLGHVESDFCWQWAPVISGTFASEDGNYNGILDAFEDANNNAVLDPGNIAEAPPSVMTDANGFAFFNVSYPQDRSQWVDVRLEAATMVAGSEFRTRAEFTLPISAEELPCESEAPPLPPPGAVSPYGS